MKRTVLIKLNVNDSAKALVADVEVMEVEYGYGVYKVWYDMGDGWMYDTIYDSVNKYSAILTWASNKWGEKLVAVEPYNPLKVDDRLIAVIDGFMKNALEEVDKLNDEQNCRQKAYLQGRIETLQQVKDTLTMPHIQNMWMKYFKVDEK